MHLLFGNSDSLSSILHIQYLLTMESMFCQIDESENPSPDELVPRSARRLRMEKMEMHEFHGVSTDMDVSMSSERRPKRRQQQKHELQQDSAMEMDYQDLEKSAQDKGKGILVSDEPPNMFSLEALSFVPVNEPAVVKYYPRFGATYVCGRRRNMEDAVALHPWLTGGAHFYGVYDGHGCSHVAMKCRDRMHEIVKEEIDMQKEEISSLWEETMKRSFSRMDDEAVKLCNDQESSKDCLCELQTPQCHLVGSTAVVAIVTPDKIIVSNCGDSRAIIRQKGVATPLSSDQKPDRADELKRIEDSGGHVVYWEGARVLGVLAMSRAIGDSCLKPFVISEPEVRIIDRTVDDEFLVLASDGLWDVVSNDTACDVASVCLGQQNQPLEPLLSPEIKLTVSGESSDKACRAAATLLTKLALGRYSADNVSVVVVDLRGEQHYK